MFKKEAEEYANKYVTEGVDELKIKVIKGHWQDGAEFGYNKANEKIKLIKATYRQSLDFLTNQIEELHKANEWHYPSKGEYPKDGKKVLCILGDFENDNLEVGHYSQVEEDSKRWRFEDYDLPDDSENGWGVYAWKEIVPPKEEEND